jgi:Protein of unknown function (DUF3352)
MTDQDPTQRVDAPPPPEAPLAPPAGPTYATPVESGADPATAAATTVPVTPTKRPGRSRVRWLLAAVLTLAVAGMAAAATLLLTGGSGDPAVLSWAPRDTVAYTELRLDLPGDQAAELAKVMQAFPGFEDQAAFPTKLNEALDQLVSRQTDGKQTYTTDIAPWFGGQLSLSMGPLPTTKDAASARVLLLVSTRDAAKAQAWADALVTQHGATTSTETYNGVTITTATPTSGTPDAMHDLKAGYAIVGPVLALGDVASVKAAIDTNGKNGLPTDEQFKAAEASLSDDRLAFAYVDNAAILDGAKALAGDMASQMPEVPAVFESWAAPWTAVSVRAQDDAFVLESRSPHVAAAGPAKNAESKLPSLVPATTVAFAEGHDVAERVKQIKDALASDPTLADGVKKVDDTLAIIGGLDAITGWMGEAGVAITADGQAVNGGLVVTPTDPAAPQRLFDQLKAFIALGGGQAGLKVTEQDYNGTKITLVDLGGLGGMLAGQAGLSAGDTANLQLAYAVTDEVVAIGTPDFVKQVLDTRAGGPSLAGSDRFKTALDRAGKSHAALFWVDVKGTLDFVQARFADKLGASYGTDVKPFLQAFDNVVGTVVPGDSIDNRTVIISVSGD